jgi:hypothetical protein
MTPRCQCRRLWGRQEHQSKFADLQLVAVGQYSRVHGFTVDIGAGEAADVDNPEFGVDAPELGVLAADGDVVEEDIAIRVTSGRRDGLVEQEPRPGVGAALHHQQRRALRRAGRAAVERVMAAGKYGRWGSVRGGEHHAEAGLVGYHSLITVGDLLQRQDLHHRFNTL